MACFFDFGLERADFGTWTSYTKFSEKNLVKILSKRVKIGEKVRFRQIFFIWWLNAWKTLCMQNLSFLSLFVTPKMDIFIMRFYENQKNSAEIVSKGVKIGEKGVEAQYYWIRG